MVTAHVEILVEPFEEDRPGPHVTAAIDAFENAGLHVDMGPFATTVDGELDAAITAVADALRAGFHHGAERIRVSVERA